MDPTFFKRPSSKNVFWGDPGESILEEIKVCFSPNLFPSLKYIFRGGRWSFHGLFRSMMQPWSFSFQSAATGKIKDTSAKHGQAHMEILCFESPGTSPPDHSIRKILIDKSWQIPPVSVWKSDPAPIGVSAPGAPQVCGMKTQQHAAWNLAEETQLPQTHEVCFWFCSDWWFDGPGNKSLL
jgi:hypothetical protein